MFVVAHAEAQRVFGALDQQQRGGLRKQRQNHQNRARRCWLEPAGLLVTHRDVRLVDVVLSAPFGDEQHAVEQEERPLVSGPGNLEVSLQNQLAVGGEVLAIPVQQQGLDLLNTV